MGDTLYNLTKGLSSIILNLPYRFFFHILVSQSFGKQQQTLYLKPDFSAYSGAMTGYVPPHYSLPPGNIYFYDAVSLKVMTALGHDLL